MLLHCLLAVACFGVAHPIQDPAYFPENVLGAHRKIDEFLVRSYSDALRVMHEPSLLALAKDPDVHVYRFTWLRSFHEPIAIRLRIQGDGSGVLTVKKTSRAQAGESKRLSLDKERQLSKDDVASFLQRITESGFWELPSRDDRIGFDGARWILEGVQGARYHVVDRWSPENGQVRKLGTHMIKLAKLGLPRDEIY